MFGVRTNSLLKNLGWAKKGILSFSNTPLNMHEFRRRGHAGPLYLRLALLQIIRRLLFPNAAARRHHDDAGH